MPKKSAKAQPSTTAQSELVTDTRRLVSVEPERVVHVSSTDYPGHYPDEDHSWSLEKFKKVRISLYELEVVAEHD
jgi:DNA-directed RNA polymerase I and III subunit RPAC1